MSSKISILPVNISTFAPDLAALEDLVFKDDKLLQYCFDPNPNPNTPSASTPAQLEERAKKLASPPPSCTIRVLKAVTETGELVGAAYWELLHEAPRESLKEIIERETEGGTKSRWPVGANVQLCEDSFGRADWNRERFVGHRASAALKILIVHPAYQRRGIGTRLLKEGLKEVDRADLPMWLGASKEGMGLYLKHGFVVDEEWELDLRPYGGESVEWHACMHREARSLSGH